MCERNGREVLRARRAKCWRNRDYFRFCVDCSQASPVCLNGRADLQIVNDRRDWSSSGHHSRPSVQGLSKCRRGIECMTRKVDDAKPARSLGRSISLRMLNLPPRE
jgi:hypothetical protein